MKKIELYRCMSTNDLNTINDKKFKNINLDYTVQKFNKKGYITMDQNNAVTGIVKSPLRLPIINHYVPIMIKTKEYKNIHKLIDKYIKEDYDKSNNHKPLNNLMQLINGNPLAQHITKQYEMDGIFQIGNKCILPIRIIKKPTLFVKSIIVIRKHKTHIFYIFSHILRSVFLKFV